MKWKFDNKPDNDEAVINTFQYFLRLKALYRQGWLQRNVPDIKTESVADHSFGIAMLALLLCPPELDKLKVLEIALLHETGECIIGDLTPWDNLTEEKKSEMEKNAVIKILSNLPDDKRLISLWEEFEYETTEEGKFVRQLDKLEMGLQAEIYEKFGENDAKALLESAHQKVTDEKLKKYLKKLD
ncbi:MAG: HD domain-containing protein [Candidatus Cloacimonetes bacterium]|nr:HD domain-containing protein [Candidatus Cloacimonadota bacterium]MCF7813861.1 HD domain-containing protein [Candidatus Cloacimonadota bacterium]MCF7868299.1 HD domain-containing protein [Candidatus Cloacimonadota bacterium]MCF7883727.1 HD domain-containing protein [Candidatus Cloacimonadota bacterium]